MSPVCRWVMSEPPCVPKRGDVVVVIAHLSHWLWTLVFELAASHAAPRVRLVVALGGDVCAPCRQSER